VALFRLESLQVQGVRHSSSLHLIDSEGGVHHMGGDPGYAVSLFSLWAGERLHWTPPFAPRFSRVLGSVCCPHCAGAAPQSLNCLINACHYIPMAATRRSSQLRWTPPHCRPASASSSSTRYGCRFIRPIFGSCAMYEVSATST
jgi:hypothetical protein